MEGNYSNVKDADNKDICNYKKSMKNNQSYEGKMRFNTNSGPAWKCRTPGKEEEMSPKIC